jgi:hypothetical protein
MSLQSARQFERNETLLNLRLTLVPRLRALRYVLCAYIQHVLKLNINSILMELFLTMSSKSARSSGKN